MSTVEAKEEDTITNNNLKTTLTPNKSQPSNEEEEHYLGWINSKVVIRKVHSLGIPFQLWPAATTLINFVSPSLSNLLSLPQPPFKLLELGSGTGLVGISFAAALGCHATLTDLPHVLPNLRYNAALNLKTVSSHGGEVEVAALSWGDEKEMELIGCDYDLIVGSDVVYCEDLFDPLFRTLKYLMLGRSANKGVVFVMGHLKRWKKENSFFKKAKKVFDVKVLHTDEPCDGRRLGVVVYTFRAKAKAKASLVEC